MANYELVYRDADGILQSMLIDSETLDPGELRDLKYLGKCAHFTLERVPAEKLPGMDHDALDDVRREMSAPYVPGLPSWKAYQRIGAQG